MCLTALATSTGSRRKCFRTLRDSDGNRLGWKCFSVTTHGQLMPWAIHNEDNYILPESQWLDEGLYAPSWAKSTKIGCKPNQYQRGWHVVVSKEECDLHYCRVIDAIRQVKFKQVVRYGYSYGFNQIPTIVCKQIYIIPQGEEVLG